MFILDQPYVSEFLKQSIIDHKIPVLANDFAKSLYHNSDIKLISETEARNLIELETSELLYTNSENAIGWIANNLSSTNYPEKINLFKDKIKFRQLLKPLCPEFKFEEVSFDKLDTITFDNFSFPFIIKPVVGFFSLGVHKVKNPDAWKLILESIKKDVEKIKNVYPLEVLNVEKFIIEENIEGNEFAFDAYYNSKGEPVILSLLKHLFSNDGDVHDRIYVSSNKIIESNIVQFKKFLTDLGSLAGLRNFPLHVEVRVDDNSKLTPIEINPLRTGGWCTTADMTSISFGFNVYEYLHKQIKPDWTEILNDKQGKVFSNIVLNNSTGKDVSEINKFDYEALISKFVKPLELRKTDFKKFLIFGFLFTETQEKNLEELEWILHADFKEFIS